jgi:leucyl-tRNA synthetase
VRLTVAHDDEVGSDARAPLRYDAQLANEIELRWQDRWESEGTFNTPNPAGPLAEGFERVAGQPKFFLMDMFPYPSGAGLHVGHPLGYIATDVFARYLRMSGHNVLHPFGYDAFGLPAEQYAIDTGQRPEVTTRNNIAAMKRQLRRLGLAHDSRREFATTDVSYYKWTQWIFLKIFNSWFDDKLNRARPIEELVAEFESGNRAPAVPDGRPWAALTEAERRKVVDDCRLAYISEEMVNWCPGLGTVLANEEITVDGRSDVGNYPVYRRPLRQWMLRITAYAERLLRDLDILDWPESIKLMQRNWIGPSDGALIDFAVAGAEDTTIRVFTTRPDTLPGATYLVLAPEHPLADSLTTRAWPEDTPREWRYPEGRDRPDADWTPAAAVRCYREQAARLSEQQRSGEQYAKTGVFTGSYAINPMTGERIPVFIADYVLTGYGTGAIQAVPAHDERDLEFASRFGLPSRTVPAELDRAAAVAAATDWLQQRGIGRGERSYRLRDWLFSRQRYWGEPFPIVYDEHGPLALPERLLPVRLPEMRDFRPEPQDDNSSEPVPPLARATAWAQVELDLGNGARRYRRELNVMPQWAGSCWYYLRYLDPANNDQLAGPEVERYWMLPRGGAAADGGVDLYVGGVEHAVLHLLYARFWHKVLYDLGYVSSEEPFKRLFNQGYILADAFTDSRGLYVPAAEVTAGADGHPCYRGQPVQRRQGKMGKSLKNGISPDDIYSGYGADTLRLYEMAMGPLDADRPWHTDDIVGVHRFLQRLWRNIVDERTGEPLVADTPLDDETARRLHRTIKVVRKDFAGLRFNTAIARLMELNTHAGHVAATNRAIPRALAEPLVLMVAPLAPHVAEELWCRLGHAESLAYAAFPEYQEALATEDSVLMPVQVNGRTRFRIEVPGDAGEEQIRGMLRDCPDYARHTGGSPVRRIVVVPGRIANIVTS